MSVFVDTVSKINTYTLSEVRVQKYCAKMIESCFDLRPSLVSSHASHLVA